MLCCEVTQAERESLYGPAWWLGVPERFPDLRLSCGRVRARRAGVRIPSLRARGPCQLWMRAQRTEILANFGELWRYFIQLFDVFD